MRQQIEALYHACVAGDLSRVRQIVEEGHHDANGDNRWGADIDPNGWERSPLHVAIECGHLELARWLIANGADVNRRNRFGDTALSSICRPPLRTHWVAAVELLMSSGADPAVRNDEGESALDLVRKVPANWASVLKYFPADDLSSASR
jgi:ankyrin repeat protein